mmetsp:Transcript_8471/g.25397  ORF Transcript_8471/g.25397 Transcript_8471/m.25397 type:complete len:254 (-) Transcript_8471:2140-2901(-)
MAHIDDLVMVWSERPPCVLHICPAGDIIDGIVLTEQHCPSPKEPWGLLNPDVVMFDCVVAIAGVAAASSAGVDVVQPWTAQKLASPRAREENGVVACRPVLTTTRRLVLKSCRTLLYPQLCIVKLAIQRAGEHFEGGRDASHRMPSSHSLGPDLVRVASQQLCSFRLQDRGLICIGSDFQNLVVAGSSKHPRHFPCGALWHVRLYTRCAAVKPGASTRPWRARHEAEGTVDDAYRQRTRQIPPECKCPSNRKP